MMWKMFTIYDRAAAVHMPPFVVRSAAEAVRAAEQAGRDGATPVSKYPGEFFLLEIGTYDDSTGNCAPFAATNSYGSIAELLEKSQARK